MKNLGILAAVIPLILAIGVFFTFVNGLILKQMWIWYVTPVFHIASPALGLCMGLGMLIFYFTQSHHTTRPKEYETDPSGVTATFLAPIGILFMGWVVHSLWV